MADDNIIRLEADATKAVAEFERLKAAATTTEAQISAGFDDASASADRFLETVATGGKGAERALALTNVQIDKLEAELAQLKAQGKPTATLEAGIESLRAKLALGTAQLGKFKAAAADASDATRKATQRAGEFSGSVTDVTNTLKTLSPALGNAIDKYSILAAKAFVAVKALQVGAEAAKELAKATGEYNGATKDAIDSANGFATALLSFDFAGAIRSAGQFLGTMHDLTQGISETTVALGEMANAADAKNFAGMLKVQRDLVGGHEAETAALNKKAEAILREVATQQQAGEVQGWLKDQVLQTIQAYGKAFEEVPPALQGVADSLGIVTKEQEKTTASAEKLEEVGVQSSQARAAAETQAAAEIVAALEKERVALDAKLAQDEARLAKALDKAGPLDDSVDTGEAAQEVGKLKDEIKRLNDQPMLDPEELNRLTELEDRARKAERSLGDLNNVFTVTGDNFLDEGQAAEAAAAAWDVYGDRLNKAQFEHERVMDSLDESEESFGAFEDAADSAGGVLEDVAEAAGEIGKEAKKGADAAKEGLDGLKAGAEEAIPLLEQIKGLLAEIKQAASEVEL